MIEFPMTLETSRVKLKVVEPTLDNAEMMYKAIEDNRAHLVEWLSWADIEQYSGPKNALDFLTIKQEDRKNGLAFLFGIFFDDKYVGAVDVFNVSYKNKSCDVGYWLVENVTGKGIMQEVLKAVEKVAFELGIHRIQITCNSKNIHSANVARRLGYHLDGKLRENRILKDGSFRTTCVFSKLKSEWETENKK